MTVMEDKIMNTILSDEELLNYVERLVAKRLPAGPHLKSDIEWYKQVIDLSINQAFEELQVVETLNYQISQLGKYLKKKSQEEIDYSRANQDSDVDTSYGERHSVEHPSFSSSEPVQRTRKPRKELPNKMVNIPNDEQTDKQLQKQAYRIQMQQQKKEDRQNQINGSDEIDKITSNLKLQHALDLANRCISSDELSNYNDLYPELSDLPSRERFDTIDEPLRPSMSYANELNNLSQSTNLRNIEENNENNFILRVPNNNQTLKDQNQNQNQNQNQSRNNTARYSSISSGTESLESYNLDPYLHHEENNKYVHYSHFIFLLYSFESLIDPRFHLIISKIMRQPSI